MRLALGLVLTALLLPLLPAGAASAAAPLPLGRYEGRTGDGHVFRFTVERSRKAGHPRKITHFHAVYDIAGCRSGPIRQPFFASVAYGADPDRRGRFARDIGLGGRPGTSPRHDVQLRLTGRFRPGGATASGRFAVGVKQRCPITADTRSLSFKVRRTGGLG